MRSRKIRTRGSIVPARNALAAIAVAATLGATAAAAPRPSTPARYGDAGTRAALDDVIAVERAFSQDSLKLGIKRSFLKYVADDGVIFRPGPVAAVATLNMDSDDDEGVTLEWWPVMAAIARSGDLALSVGPWVMRVPSRGSSPQKEVYGYYATIWRKQVDGRWKFVIDGAGAKIEGRAMRVPGSAVEKLATSSWGHGAGPARALAEARAAEEHMAALARQDARGAISKYLASRAWLMGSSVEPNGDAEAAKAELSRRPAQLALHYVGGEASAAGDLVFTYGRAESTDPEVPLTDASYLNVWQRQPSGWRLIFEGLKSRR